MRDRRPCSTRLLGRLEVTVFPRRSDSAWLTVVTPDNVAPAVLRPSTISYSHDEISGACHMARHETARTIIHNFLTVGELTPCCARLHAGNTGSACRRIAYCKPVRSRGRVDGDCGELGIYMAAAINPASAGTIRWWGFRQPIEDRCASDHGSRGGVSHARSSSLRWRWRPWARGRVDISDCQ
jgi:hypothetical protein